MKSALLLVVIVILSVFTTSCTHVSKKKAPNPTLDGLENNRNPSFDRLDNIRW